MTSTFAQHVDNGLSSHPKRLSSMYFYDDKGSALFEEIMKMPTYYLTRAETDIFTHQAPALIEYISMPKHGGFDLIELGAGNGEKTLLLLEALTAGGYDFIYKPIDISEHALAQLGDKLKERLPNLAYAPMLGDYFQQMQAVSVSSRPKTVLFLGSNLGNMTDEAAHSFLGGIADHLHTGDHMVLGLDLIKEREIVLPAYNDSTGITRAFNLNILTRINRELGADFDLDDFAHVPSYDANEGIARSSLVAKRAVTVTITATGRSYTFEAQEPIAVEQSRKYSDEVLEAILEGLPWTIKAKLLDQQAYFADYILRRA